MKASNKRSEITLTDVDGEIRVCNVITFDRSDDTEESDFFKSVDSKVERCRVILDADGKFLNSDWIFGEKEESASLNKYPDELHQVISKGLNGTKNIANDKGVTFIYEENKLDIQSGFFDDDIDTVKKATLDFNEQIKRLKAMNGSASLEDMIDRYFFRKHLLIRGKKGVGKTYSVDKRLEDEGIDYEFIAGHDGIESIDLLGYYVKDASGHMVWLDGALTKAFRKAQKDKCCLFFDEILRMPSRELNILVGALTPTSRKTYRLRTNRIINNIDGIGETEVIEVSVDNLWCVSTTNIGAGYEVDEIDSALSDRFRIVDKDVSTDELDTILSVYAGLNGISKTVVDKLISFYTKSNDLVVSGELEKEVNLRHLCEVLQFSKTDDDVKQLMFDLVPTWCSTDTDGSVNKAEREIVTKLIKKMI